MTTLTQVAQAMQTVLTTVADQAARLSQFVQRESKLTGAKFTQTLVFGWLDDPEATYEQLAQTATALGVPITAQGLDYRFTPEAADCLKHVLETTLHQVVTADPLTIPLLQRFNGIYLQDATTITLPDALASVWAGCGGTTAEGTSAALKAPVQVNFSDGQLTHLDLQAGRASDRAAPMQTAPLPPGALRIADLGYFSIPVLQAYDRQQVFWLTRYRAKVGVVEATGEPLDLVAFLQSVSESEVDLNVQVGLEHRMPCRLVARRLPADLAQARRRKLKAELRDQGRTPSATQLALLEWVIFLTNVPPTRLNVREVLVLARVRWQIELLFKLWKSHGRVDESRSHKPYRILCEVYAKLIAMVIQHWVLLISCWHFPNRSLFKAAKTIRQHALALGRALASLMDLAKVLETIQRCLTHGARLNSRQGAPNAYQRLLACSMEGLP